MNLILKKLSTALTLLFSINSHAALIAYTNSTAFNTAISGYTSATLDFESSTAGDLIANGSTLGGITFNYPALASIPVSMQILDTYSATSGFNYLGTDSGGAFQGGDSFSLSFAPVNALGLFFFSGDALFDGDISLTVGTTVASLSSAYESILADGSYVYFLGLIDNANTFGSVDVASGCVGCYEFNVDDITTATTGSNPVPTPPILWLLLVGLLPLLRKLKVES